MRAAHRQLAVAWHPDKNPQRLREAHRRMAEANHARDTLARWLRGPASCAPAPDLSGLSVAVAGLAKAAADCLSPTPERVGCALVGLARLQREHRGAALHLTFSPEADIQVQPAAPCAPPAYLRPSRYLLATPPAPDDLQPLLLSRFQPMHSFLQGIAQRQLGHTRVLLREAEVVVTGHQAAPAAPAARTSDTAAPGQPAAEERVAWGRVSPEQIAAGSFCWEALFPSVQVAVQPAQATAAGQRKRKGSSTVQVGPCLELAAWHRRHGSVQGMGSLGCTGVRGERPAAVEGGGVQRS